MAFFLLVTMAAQVRRDVTEHLQQMQLLLPEAPDQEKQPGNVCMNLKLKYDNL